MKKKMKESNSHGLEMMSSTCCIQTNLDYVFSFSLGKRVLRADTAAICALALLRSKKN